MTNVGDLRSTCTGAVNQPHQLLAALLSAPIVGVAICDRRLRFRAINDALATMNGAPAASHIGKPLHHILGNVASKVGAAFQQVFATGQPLSNFELSAQLPLRSGMGHWLEYYYPIKSRSGRVLRVSAIVVEVTSADLGQSQPSVSPAIPAAPPFPSQSRPVRALSDKSHPRPQPLTDRERQVVLFLANGKSNKEIAAILQISPGTVAAHRANVMLKLGIHSFADLVRYAVRQNIV